MTRLVGAFLTWTRSVLVSATFADDGSLNDILRSLSLRLREPNAVVRHKVQCWRGGLTHDIGGVQGASYTSPDDQVWIYRSTARGYGSGGSVAAAERRKRELGG